MNTSTGTAARSRSLQLQRRDVLWILTTFPALYLVHGVLPHSQRLFVEQDHDAWGEFWLVVAVLHWASVAAAVTVVHRRGMTLTDLGFRASRSALAVAGGAVIAYGLAVTWMRYAFGPLALFGGNAVFGIATPWTTSEWIRWIPLAMTAGFCEELVYRGFAINGLHASGVTFRRSVLIATVAFVFLHGFSAFTLFPIYVALALAMTAVFRRTNSLLPGMVIHTLIDLSVILASTPHP